MFTLLVQFKREKTPIFSFPSCTDDRNLVSNGKRGGIVEMKPDPLLTCIPMTSKRFSIMMAVSRDVDCLV
jgi:hypothetical protein